MKNSRAAGIALIAAFFLFRGALLFGTLPDIPPDGSVVKLPADTPEEVQVEEVPADDLSDTADKGAVLPESRPLNGHTLIPQEPVFDWEAERTDPHVRKPRIALVLSGGSALGFAHIGVLRGLEAVGLPIDMVVGTSMGALVGGFYAAGYSPGDIEQVVAETSWATIFTAPNSFLTYLTGPVIDEHKMLISFNFDGSGIGKTLGLLSDQQILGELSRHLIRVSDIRNFQELPIPFSCIVVDLISGEKVVLSEGRLAHALRATISIPGLLAPYPIGDRYFVDGGVLDNLPVEAARSMGADIVIAVNTDTEHPQSISDFSSAFDIALRATSLMSMAGEKLQESSADLLIKPDLTGLDRSEFWRAEEFIERGLLAVDEQREAVENLARRIAASRSLAPKDPDRIGAYFSLPPGRAAGFRQVGDDGFALPLTMFSNLIGRNLNEEILDLLNLRINQIITSGAWESISFSYAPATPAASLPSGQHQSGSENFPAHFPNDGTDRIIELTPVPASRGRHSVNAGFMFDIGYSPASNPDWQVIPGFSTSLKFTKLFETDAYLMVDLNIERSLISSLRFFLPTKTGIFVAPHIRGGETQYSIRSGEEELFNRISFFEIGTSSGYLFSNFLEIGLDAQLSMKWLFSRVPGEPEAAAGFEIVPLVIPTVSWRNFLPSRFVHSGVQIKMQAALPLELARIRYYRILLDHEHYISASLNATVFYDLLYGSFRGAIPAPWSVFDIGGWDGIPGYLPEIWVYPDVMMFGFGYRQRFPLISEAIGMDTYLVTQFRMGNGYQDFPGWDQTTVRYGAAVGIGLSTVLGEMILGFGLNQDLDTAYYLLFN